jgi:hypothetical protein
MAKKNTTKAAKTTSTDKARKAAIAEIQARLEDDLDGPITPAKAPSGAAKAKATKAAAKAKDAPKAAVANVEAKRVKAPKKATKPGALSGAAEVLKTAAKPMTAAELWSELHRRGLWASSGRTPEATIYAAIIREIAAKGEASRFRKAERGKFEATGNA